ncbi:hypothetical protein ACFP56_01340 [Paenibacillus septentrionalis]|uniref:DUF2768 domain-containing protein n=1 Tax=Paenibacillus septentrionalis TaxID=429342 RepID=A0ABW1UXS5_9BACL
MKVNASTVFWVLLYAVMAGGSLALFSLITAFVKYLFSLLAIYIGIRFFRRYETIGLRITFIALAIVMYFLIVVIIASIQFIVDNPDLFQAAAL